VSSLAPTLEAFFTERLAQQRQASPHTVLAYGDTFRLLLDFARRRTGKAPSRLDLQDLDAPLVGAFLEHLEQERQNSVRTRNARLAAIHSFFHFAAYRHPEHAALIQRVLAIPPKRFDRAIVSFLSPPEVDALLSSPDRGTWIGRRDHALLLLALQTGLRLSELTQLTCQDVQLGPGAHVRCHGKGRKDRCTPLTAQTVAVLHVWLRERHGHPTDPLFPSHRGSALSPDAVQRLVTKYAAGAQQTCPSLRDKRVTPHVLRHTSAMQLLRAGVDTSTIALWLGHEGVETTQIYLHADLSIKERAIARTAPPGVRPGRYRASDSLLAFLDGLRLCRPPRPEPRSRAAPIGIIRRSA
jgi:site-specific recombinase XerD